MYSAGTIQIICITDMDLVKEISQCTSLTLGKPTYLSKDRGPLLGQGILASSGPLWAHQRKVIAPQLYPERVKVSSSGPDVYFLNETNLLLIQNNVIVVQNQYSITLKTKLFYIK